jgi:acetyltransferase
MKNGVPILFRPIRPEDEPLMVKFHETLSEQTVYLRYFHMDQLSARVAHERLIRKCFIDYDKEMALVADHADLHTGQHEILAVGRLSRENVSTDAEVAILVTDRYHHQGLGTELLGRLIEVARGEKYDRIIALILPENSAMCALAAHFHFQVERSSDPSMVVAILTL